MDFVQIMHDWRRMCDKHSCSCLCDKHLRSRDKLMARGLPTCPVAIYCTGQCDEDPLDWTEEATMLFADVVNNWARANPELKPITWGELLKELGVISDSPTTGFRFEDSAAVPEHIVKMLKAKE